MSRYFNTEPELPPTELCQIANDVLKVNVDCSYEVESKEGRIVIYQR